MSYYKSANARANAPYQTSGAMSYARPALSGISSQRPGAPVFTNALGATAYPGMRMAPRRPPPPPQRPHTLRSSVRPPPWYRQLGGPPDWYQSMSNSTLGGDTIGGMSEEQWRAEMLAGQQALVAAQKHWADGDKMQKWIQIGVTASIPLAAAVWRALGIGRRG